MIARGCVPANLVAQLIFSLLVNCHDLVSQTVLKAIPDDAQSTVQAKLNDISVDSRGSKCNQAERDLDRCSANLIGFGTMSEDSLPGSVEELDSVFCPKFRETISCIKRSASCYEPFERQIISWILISSKTMNNKRCKNEGEKERFLRLTSSCLSQMRDPMDRCMTRYIASLEAIADLNESVKHVTKDDIQIQLSCCANQRFKQCITGSAKQKCRLSERLGRLKMRTNSLSSCRSARKYIQRFMLDTMDDLRSTLDGMALTGPEFICSGIDEKFCKTKFDNRYDKDRAPRHKSVVPAMIKIYRNKESSLIS